MKKDIKMVYESDHKHGLILNVRLDSTNEYEVLTAVSRFLAEKKKFSLFTPNPEIVLEASGDKNFLDILNSGSINIPDGVGLSYASRFLHRKPLNIIPGRRLFEILVEESSKKGWSIFLLGGLKNEAEKTAGKLKEKYSGLKVNFLSGPVLDSDAEPVSERDINMHIDAIKKINEACKNP